MRRSGGLATFLGAFVLTSLVVAAWLAVWLGVGAILDNWAQVTAWQR